MFVCASYARDSICLCVSTPDTYTDIDTDTDAATDTATDTRMQKQITFIYYVIRFLGTSQAGP